MEAFERIEKSVKKEAKIALRLILIFIAVTLVLTSLLSLHCGLEHLPSESVCMDALYTSYILSTHITSTLWNFVQMLPAFALLIIYLPRVHR